MTSKEIVDKVVEALDSKKGIDIEVLDVADKTTLADEVEYLVKTDLGLYADHVEGRSGDRWMLIDYRDVVVHVMHPEERANYNLEKLWSTITLDRPMDDDEE